MAWTAQGSTALASLTTTDGFNAGGSLISSDTYDNWNRLTSFDNGSGNWGQNFSYDLTDNLTKSVITGRTGTSWNPGYSSTTNQCIGCSYDSDGNQTADGTGTNYWGYDAYSKQAWYNTSSLAPTCGTNGKCFTFDAFGRAVEMSNGGSWVELWPTQAGSANMSGTTLNYAYWSAPGGGEAILNGNSTNFYYLHKDWLGNARLVSDLVARTYTADRSYTPYGEIIANYGSTNSAYDEFAGMTANFNNGIQYETPNREFAIFGRWLSPDPAGTGWNQYAYPTNPNSFTDPLGLCVFNSDPCGMNDARGSQSEDRDFANSSTWIVNGEQVPGAVAGSLLGMDDAMLCPNSGCANVRLGSQGQWQMFVQSSDPNAPCTTGASFCVGVQGTWMNAYWTAPDDAWHISTAGNTGPAHNGPAYGGPLQTLKTAWHVVTNPPAQLCSTINRATNISAGVAAFTGVAGAYDPEPISKVGLLGVAATATIYTGAGKLYVGLACQ